MPTSEKRLTKLEIEFEHIGSKIDAILEVVIPTHKDVQVMKEDIKDIKELQKYLPA